jgi:phage terminase large subunit-like protein
VRLVSGQWNEKYLDELCTFPSGLNDDQVDASSDAFIELALGSNYDTSYSWVR